MAKKHHHKIRTSTGMIVLVITPIMLLANLINKFIQIYHLSQTGWDMRSFNIFGLLALLVASFLYTVMTFITKAHKGLKALGIISLVSALVLFVAAILDYIQVI